MRTTIKLSLAALMAAMLLASGLSTASARNLSVSNQNWRVTWSRLEFASSLVTVRCQVTLEGSFHSRTIPKIQALLFGAVTKINMKTEGCTGGTMRPERPAPWHLTYEGFTGRLPNIETIRLLLQRYQYAITAFGVTCKYGTPADNLTFSGALNAAGEVTNITPLTGRNISYLLEGGGLCPATHTLTGTATDGTVTLLNANTRIRVTLI